MSDCDCWSWEDEAERYDALEAVRTYEDALVVCRAELADQCHRTVEVYGRRRHWPAICEMAVRKLEADVARLVSKRDEAATYHADLTRRYHAYLPRA
jgi:hypothetical protein